MHLPVIIFVLACATPGGLMAPPSCTPGTADEQETKPPEAVCKLLAEFAGEKYRYIGDHLVVMVNAMGIADANSFLLGQLTSDSRMRSAMRGSLLPYFATSGESRR